MRNTYFSISLQCTWLTVTEGVLLGVERHRVLLELCFGFDTQGWWMYMRGYYYAKIYNVLCVIYSIYHFCVIYSASIFQIVLVCLFLDFLSCVVFVDLFEF